MLPACSTPPLVGYVASYKNACNYPVRVFVPLEFPDAEPLDKLLNTDENIDVMRFTCLDERGFLSFLADPHEGLRKCIPKDYIMAISANGKQRIVDSSQLLDILKQTNYTGEDVYFWTIYDPSLCP